jgi:hypothetical protein
MAARRSETASGTYALARTRDGQRLVARRAARQAARPRGDYWRTGTDWRRCEKILNRLPQYRTEIDGLGIHFLYVRSPHADALPIVITHGWPGSIIEFFKIIDPKANPTAHGGRAEDAFHVIEDTAAVGGLTSRLPAKKRTYRPARRVLIVRPIPFVDDLFRCCHIRTGHTKKAARRRPSLRDAAWQIIANAALSSTRFNPFPPIGSRPM